jgi:predicted DNA-binding transcriptional regulator AlpA
MLDTLLDDCQRAFHPEGVSHHLVGSAEAAAILGISRQRLAQLVTEAMDFPAPEVVLKAGRIWSRAAIEAWAANHPERRREDRRVVVPPFLGDHPPQVLAIIGLAGKEAAARNHHWLGVEHLELALVHPDCPGAAKRVLAFYNVPVTEAQDRYWAAWGDPFEPSGTRQTVTPRVHQVLERATLEAVQLQDEEVGSEHVLLAVLASGRWGSGPISSYLVARGVDAEVLRARILEVTEGSGEDRPDPWDHLALAASPAGHDPRRRQPWGSQMFVDTQGRPIRRGRWILQYFVDRDNYPVRTADGRFVHALVDEGGNVIRDGHGGPAVGAVDVPPEGIVPP